MSEQLTFTRDRKKDWSQWYTPTDLANRIVEWAVRPGALPAPNQLHALEPSAGIAALARPLKALGAHVTCVDIDPENCVRLRAHGFVTLCADFLELQPEGNGDPDVCELPRFDLAIMNPPFEGGATEQHIMHALKFADRVVCHCPLTTLAGKARRASLWSKVQLHRLAICSTRPKYGAGGGATDMCTIDVTLSEGLEHPTAQPKVEWWP